MGPVGYFIAILGCADSGASCQTVATLAPRYEAPPNRSASTGAEEQRLDFQRMMLNAASSVRPRGDTPVGPRENRAFEPSLLLGRTPPMRLARGHQLKR